MKNGSQSKPDILLTLVALMLAFACTSGLSGGADKIRPKIAIKARPISLSQVRLLEGPFKDAMERDRNYLHSLDPDRLLHMFRVTAGLPSSAQPYGGWEKPGVELRGHSIGHYLSACALMYASTGDDKLKARADTIVGELAKCQNAMGRSGYLSAFPEEFIDRVETGKQVWAPWYTLHKIFAGLLDTNLYCGNQQALKVATGMAGWAKRRADRLNDEQMQRMLQTEFGGMNEVLRNLYAVTGNENMSALARRFDQKSILDPLAAHQDKLRGLHVNTQIPKIIGAARAYELSGERYYYDVATYFWSAVTGTRSYVTGGTSNDELWRGDPNQIACELGPHAHETCCTYNMLKLTRHLFGWNPDPAYADYYERALFNGILSTQNPENGMVMYYVSMTPGLYKTFMEPEDSFWCCTGTGMENHAKYGDSIYFRGDSSVYVNLFIASELRLPEYGIRIRQETKFPEQQGTSLLVAASKPVELSLNIRIPSWVARGGEATLNGKKLENFPKQGSYLELRRSWADGDRLDLSLPMNLHLERTPDDPNTAAVLYGPLVLAGQLGGSLPRDKTYGPMGPSGPPATAPYFIADTGKLDSWIKPIGGLPLTFRTLDAGKSTDILLVPFYRLFGGNYSIYWNIYSPKEWSDAEANSHSLPPGPIDSLKIGDAASDETHHHRGYAVQSGEASSKKWIRSSSWFSFDLRSFPDRPVVLQCAFLREDEGLDFDIEIEHRRIGRQPLSPAGTGDISGFKYPLPLEWTQGKKLVNVVFRAGKGNATPRLVACSTVKE